MVFFVTMSCKPLRHETRENRGFEMNKVTSLDPGTDSTVRAAWFPT